MENKCTLGQALRSKRKNLGITIKELGSKVGLSEQAISQYELDKRTPDETTLIRLAVALKTSAISLLANSGKNQEYIESFYDTAIAFVNNTEKPDEIENDAKYDPLSYYLGQYIHTLGYDIIGDPAEGYLSLKTNIGEYEITENDLIDLKASSKSFIEYKLHEIINKSRKIGKEPRT